MCDHIRMWVEDNIPGILKINNKNRSDNDFSVFHHPKFGGRGTINSQDINPNSENLFKSREFVSCLRVITGAPLDFFERIQIVIRTNEEITIQQFLSLMIIAVKQPLYCNLSSYRLPHGCRNV